MRARMLQRALILSAVVLTIVLLGPYVGVHLLGTRPLPHGAEERAPRRAERIETPDTARKPPQKVEDAEGKSGTKGETGRLSEIEELLK